MKRTISNEVLDAIVFVLFLDGELSKVLSCYSLFFLIENTDYDVFGVHLFLQPFKILFRKVLFFSLFRHEMLLVNL